MHPALEVVRMMIASSPIRIVANSLAARLADWANTRRAPDVDLVILDWIANHVRGDRAVRRFDA